MAPATRAAAASLIVIAAVATIAALAIGQEQAQTRDAIMAKKLARLNERTARELAQEQSQLALDAIREYNIGVTREFLLQQPEMENLQELAAGPDPFLSQARPEYRTQRDHRSDSRMCG